MDVGDKNFWLTSLPSIYWTLQEVVHCYSPKTEKNQTPFRESQKDCIGRRGTYPFKKKLEVDLLSMCTIEPETAKNKLSHCFLRIDSENWSPGSGILLGLAQNHYKPITANARNTSKQNHAIGAKRGRREHADPRLVLVLLVTGWKSSKFALIGWS